MRTALRGLAVVSFVMLLVAATSAYSPSRLLLAAAADAGSDAGRTAASIFGPSHYMAASKSFGGAPLDPQGFGGLGLRGGGDGGTAAGDAQGFGGLGLRGSGNVNDSNSGDRTITTRLNEQAPTVSGPLDVILVRRVVRRHTLELHDCVENNAAPKAQGELTLSFVIAPSGDIESALVTAHNAAIEKCVMATLKTWKFPQPRPAFSVTVKYPFVFAVETQ
jgi:hypothetical protein